MMNAQVSSSPALQSPFMKACRREATPFTPVWLMRQAGRFLPEYRAIRGQTSFIDMCKNPELACEVTLQPIRRFGLDAAIIFSDLLVVFEPMGFGLRYAEGEGPVITPPIRRASDVDQIKPVEVEASLQYVYDAIRLVRAALAPDLPLIGFAGAPYTLASYLIEGRGSRTCELTKAFMREEPKAWSRLLERLAVISADHLTAQWNAGAQAVQLFDSWAGTLTPAEYETSVWAHSRDVFDRLPDEVTSIHFGTGTGKFLERFANVNADVISVDADVALDEAWRRIGDKAIQGNLDPQVLLTDPATILKEGELVLRRAEGRPGHVFNLGHGVLQPTPPDHVKVLVDFVHAYQRK